MEENSTTCHCLKNRITLSFKSCEATSSLSHDDLRAREEEWTFSRSAIYLGAWPCSALKVKIKILKWNLKWMNEEKPKLEWYVSGVGQIRYGCNPFCFSTCNSIKFEAIALKLLHKIPTFVSYKWHLFKALQECHRPCVLTLNTLHFFFTICPNIWVGCNTCWGEWQKLDKRNKKESTPENMLQKRGLLEYQKICLYFSDWS